MANSQSKEPSFEVKAKISGSDEWKEWCKTNKNSNKTAHGTSGALYFVGFIGSLIYWLQAAVGFGAFITAFLKSLVWPAYIVYKLLENFYGVVN